MYIDNDDFEKWMERLSQKLNDIGKDLKSFININNTDLVFPEEEKITRQSGFGVPAESLQTDTPTLPIKRGTPSFYDQPQNLLPGK